MPQYSYKERFVPFVENGTKLTTIRKRRKYLAKPGDTLYHYYALRTKYCRKLAQDKCKDVKSIYLTTEGNIILITPVLTGEWFRRVEENGVLRYIPDLINHDINVQILSGIERDNLAWHDGFRPDGTDKNFTLGAGDLMLRWFRQTHQLPFLGDIIYRDIPPG